MAFSAGRKTGLSATGTPGRIATFTAKEESIASQFVVVGLVRIRPSVMAWSRVESSVSGKPRVRP